MNTKALRQQTSLLALNRYISDRAPSSSGNGTAPGALATSTTTMGVRDAARGVYNLATLNGGSSTGKSITNSGLPTGAIIPATISTGGGNRIDARPIL